MKAYLIILLLFLSACNSGPESESQAEPATDSLLNAKTQEEPDNSRRLIDSLKNISIDWSKIPIHKLPISMKVFAKKTFIMAKYCCTPRCDEGFELNELDALFSNNTKSEALSKFEGNGHPSTHQGYFGLRLPDAGRNRVLLFSYHDIDASDYKICTIELQTFNTRNDLIDKKIIRDGMNFECGWERGFSISKDYHLTIDDYYACADLEGGDDFDVKEEKFTYKILNTGRIQNVTEPNKVSPDVFISELEETKIEKFPFFASEGRFMSGETPSTRERGGVVYPSRARAIDRFLTMDMIDTTEIFFDTHTRRPLEQIGLYFLTRFPPLNDNIERLLFGSSREATSSDFWVLATYNKKTKQFVDIKTLAVFEQASDMYYDSGLYINEDFIIKSSIHIGYESAGGITETMRKVLPSGEIKTIYETGCYQGDDSNFYDYKNDYEIFPKVKSLSPIERKQAYNHLLTQIPEVELPYNSSKFYHLMYIGSPVAYESKLHHEKLNKPKNIKYFFDKNINASATKDRKEGDYFYPIFRFQRTDSINIIGFLYQSYCNFNSAVYVKLNSYNAQGEIIESFIADRRFMGGDFRFLSSIQFEEDFSITFKRYIQDCGIYDPETEKRKEPRVINEKYFISENGNFKKIE